MTSGIYIITNTENNKVYIGSTINFQERWTNHRNQLRRKQHANPHLQRAWNRYGKSTFEFGVLEYIDVHEELHLAEQFWMDIYREEGKELYNCGLVARSPWLGRHHTEETRYKISEGNKGKTVSEETRQKISEAKKGHCPSIETRAKLSAARKGKPYPAFYNRNTGEIISAGINLKALCRERNLNYTDMHGVRTGRRCRHKGWELI